MRQYRVLLDSGGFVLRAVHGSSLPEAEKGWLEVSAEIYGRLKEQRPGLSPKLIENEVIWAQRSVRPLAVERQRSQAGLDRLVEGEVIRKVGILAALRCLAAHSVALGVLLDQDSTAKQKEMAMSRERMEREAIEQILASLDRMADRKAEIVAAINSADTLSALKAVTLEIA